MSGSVVVIGSSNLDMVLPVDRHPQPGETLLGGVLQRLPGGKGGNQAAAAAKAGDADVSFVGALGDDEAGRILRGSLTDAGVDDACIRTSELPSGTALIWVTPDGSNTILVAPGANGEVALDDEAARRVAAADVLLAQLEIPVETILAAARARGPETKFLLNAAPSAELPDELWEQVDLLIVNEHEAADLTGFPPEEVNRSAAELLERVPAVVVTVGAEGAIVAGRQGDAARVPAHHVDTVDTTGAGDTFCGVLAAELAGGATLAQAATVASAAAALATTSEGAQQSIPRRDDVAAFLS